MTARIQIGIFKGPWTTPFVARDGATLAFEDLETALLKAVNSGELSGIDLRPITTSAILASDFTEILRSLDILFCNCGPLTSLIMAIRSDAGLSIPLIREVHTLGWVGTIFQEFIARDLALPTDLTLHASRYAADVWCKLAPRNNILVHQPIIQSEPAARARLQPLLPIQLRACFLSRLARDKGLHQLPSLVRRLQLAGWPIDRLDIAGCTIDKSILSAVGVTLRKFNVTLVNHGQLPREAALSLIREADVLLFPSTSSFEALGRVVVEACSLGTTVIAADYCGAHDLLIPECLIPMQESRTIGNSMCAFPIADLEMDAWQPPAFNYELSNTRGQDALTPYNYSSAYFSKILDATLRSVPLSVTKRTPRISMDIDFDSYCNRSAEAWVADLRKKLMASKPNRKDLNDLGGVFKSCLHTVGFCPEVKFSYPGAL